MIRPNRRLSQTGVSNDIRKGTSIPYLAHLLGTAKIALEHGATEDEAIAALLHDAVVQTSRGSEICTTG